MTISKFASQEVGWSTTRAGTWIQIFSERLYRECIEAPSSEWDLKDAEERSDFALTRATLGVLLMATAYEIEFEDEASFRKYMKDHAPWLTQVVEDAAREIKGPVQ